MTHLVPFGAWFVDPKDTRGFMVLTPVVNTGDKSKERPHFIIRRSTNKDVLEYYWSKLSYVFDRDDLSHDLPTTSVTERVR